jgi:hypothetical protein
MKPLRVGHFFSQQRSSFGATATATEHETTQNDVFGIRCFQLFQYAIHVLVARFSVQGEEVNVGILD